MAPLSEEFLRASFQGIVRRIHDLEGNLFQRFTLEACNDRKINQLEERINHKLDAILELLNARHEAKAWIPQRSRHGQPAASRPI